MAHENQDRLKTLLLARDAKKAAGCEDTAAEINQDGTVVIMCDNLSPQSAIALERLGVQFAQAETRRGWVVHFKVQSLLINPYAVIMTGMVSGLLCVIMAVYISIR